MRRLDERSLPAFTLMAAIVCAPLSTLGQSPAAQPPGTTPTPGAQTTTTIQPAGPATAEQIGDALMAHQRYQAAIEAYKKAPANDATVWNKEGIAYQLTRCTVTALLISSAPKIRMFSTISAPFTTH